jgi:hypothetical protein
MIHRNASALALPFAAFPHPLAHAPRTETDVVEQRLYNSRLDHFLQNAERRAGAQLALAYARDANPAVASVLFALRDDTLLLLDVPTPEDDLGLHSLLTWSSIFSISSLWDCFNVLAFCHVKMFSNLVPHSRVTVEALSDASFILHAHQVLLVCGAFDANAEGNIVFWFYFSTVTSSFFLVLTKIHAHISAGGLVITYNTAARLVAALFPGAFASLRGGLSVKDKRVHVQARVSNEDPDASFLGAAVALSEQQHLLRVAPSQRFTLTENQSQLQPLLTEDAPSTPPLPLLMRHRSETGHGALYHLLLFSGDEILRPRSAEQSRIYLAKVENHLQLSAETKSMWRTAWSSNFDGSFYHVRPPFLSFPFFVALIRILGNIPLVIHRCFLCPHWATFEQQCDAVVCHLPRSCFSWIFFFWFDW